jgi:hypothetical protein
MKRSEIAFVEWKPEYFGTSQLCRMENIVLTEGSIGKVLSLINK